MASDTWREVEALTEPFRAALARESDARARSAAWAAATADRAAAVAGLGCGRGAAEVARTEERRALWHRGRASGQRERFSRSRACASGERPWRIAVCRACSHPRRGVQMGCDVRRVCRACDVAAAVARRARIGAARGRLLERGERAGLYLRRRAGGRFADRMLTLTVPHLDAASGDYCDTIRARVRWLFGAWALFRRKLVAHLKETHGHSWPYVHYHRAFEWTPGDDLAGHPHFHLWLHSQWIDADWLAEAWSDCVRRAGCPYPGRVRIHVKLFEAFDRRALRELAKGGRSARAAAIRLSRVTRIGPAVNLPADAVEYADGWTLSDVVGDVGADAIAALYMELEGRHISHASRGLLKEDAKCMCVQCTGTEWRTVVAVDRQTADRIVEALARRSEEACRIQATGPPLESPGLTRGPRAGRLYLGTLFGRVSTGAA